MVIVTGMFPVRCARGFAGLFMLFSIAFSIHGQVTVYQNSATPEAVVGNFSMEYGDEVMLTGTARIITRLRFEYGGSFYPNSDETARVRIYANDGAYWKGNTDYATPKTLLWESPMFPILTGFNTKDLVVPSIRVPDHFTWTIQFYGLSMSALAITPDPTIIGDYAGLSFYGLAETGASFNDFWQFLTGGWTPVRVPTVVKNNFSASVTAIPEAIVPTLQVTKTATGLKLSWPRAAVGYRLQSQSEAGSEWVSFSGGSFVIGDQYQANVSSSSELSLFRLRKAPVAAELMVTTNIDGTVRANWTSSALGKVLQSSVDGTFWRDENTPAATTAAEFEVLMPASAQGRVFRLREETKAASIEILRNGAGLLLRWPAEATGYKVQSKSPTDTSWTYVTMTPPVNGIYFEVTLSATAESQIFRLVQ
jgi:hypothetical protein